MFPVLDSLAIVASANDCLHLVTLIQSPYPNEFTFTIPDTITRTVAQNMISMIVNKGGSRLNKFCLDIEGSCQTGELSVQELDPLRHYRDLGPVVKGIDIRGIQGPRD
jgi:hypothetical protein